MIKNGFSLLFYILILSACHQNHVENSTIQGVWESVGSGWILEIEDSTKYSFYDITSISCLPKRQGALKEILPAIQVYNDSLFLTKGVITYAFTRATNLHKLCSETLSESKAESPLFNFEVFAKTVEEHYAFMELNHINWDSLYKAQKAKITNNPTDIQLYLTINEILENLNDNHGFLEATDQVVKAAELRAETKNEVIEIDNTLPEYGDFQIAGMVANHHLQESMTNEQSLIKWGKLTDHIGYIQIMAMWLYAELEIPQNLIDEVGYVDAYVQTFNQMYEGDYIKKEVYGVRKIMDKVMKDLSVMDAIVIDLRFNGGGQDAVSFEILSRFIPNRQQVATQKLRYGSQFTPTLKLFIKGKNDAYTKPVYVLTSPQTGSAAEAFSIATLATKNIKRIGSPTLGAMSTALEKTLPNGWSFAVSNEIYMDNQGKNYENIGVPVDYDLKYSRDRQAFFRSVAEDLDADKKHILEAIEKLSK